MRKNKVCVYIYIYVMDRKEKSKKNEEKTLWKKCLPLSHGVVDLLETLAIPPKACGAYKKLL